MGAADPVEERLAALGREVERLARQSHKTDTHVRELAAHLLASPPPGGGGEADDEDGPEELPAWLTITDFHAAANGLDELVRWLSAVYLRFPETELRECWAWHPHVVQELWWLNRAWLDAHAGEKASWMKVGDWHDRQRPGVTRRVTAALRSCGLDQHTTAAPEDAPVPPLTEALPHVLTAWITPDRATWPLTPTPGQLTAARELEDRRLNQKRSHR